MVNNIEKVLERGERIELLVDKTDRLNESSFRFEKTSKELKNALFYEKLKSFFIGFVIVLILAYIAAATYCGGPTLKTCIKK
mmetsp:Transcript_13005/g.15534  ORF Transcript_13005/g.15534 Transcript_13005/m.15534 type:complete len:82 (+) Transcript_13005:3-248(+)